MAAVSRAPLPALISSADALIQARDPSGARRRIGRHARVLGRRGTFDRLNVRRASSRKRVQATFALPFEEPLDELFAPALLPLGPIAQVAIPARHLADHQVMSHCREFIAEDCAT